VSLIIPNYNGGHDLIDCVRSISNLTFHDFETILVDNSSSDESVEEALKDSPELKVLRLHENLGYAKAVNFGIQASRGK
jgi:GT2 family glycosyltransferase